jgi:hypothetical protein
LQKADQLEAEANSFWSPTDLQLEALGTTLFGRPPGPTHAELRAVVLSPGDASRER